MNGSIMRTLSKHTNSAKPKSTEELKTILHRVLSYACQEGATDASVGVNHDSGFSVDVRMREVETVAFSEDKGVSVTVYIGSKKGSASSSDTTDTALHAMVRAAIEIAKVSAPDPCFGLPDIELMTNESVDLDLFHPWEISPEEAIEKALLCERHALEKDARIYNSDGTSLSTYAFCHGYATTQGFEQFSHSTRHGMSCSLIAKENDLMQRDYEYSTTRNAINLMSIEELADSAVQRTVSRLGARKIKTQSAPVVFSSRLSSGLFGAFVSAVSGSNLYRKNSFLLDSVGQQIFPSWMRIHENPHVLQGLGSSFYDAEGVPTRHNVLVENGILRQYVLSSYSARKLGLKTTANSGGVFNLTIDPTAGSLDELLAMMGNGLLVTELMGQGVNAITGDYSRGATGFWVEDGKIQYPVEEITIAGNLKDMFKAMVAVGNDLNPNSATRCGSVLIEQMVIGGH